MKRFIGLLTVVIIMVLCTAAPVLAAGLTISPPTVEFDVPANGNSRVEFLVYDFTGDLQISLEDIPLTVEPTTVPVTAKKEGTRVVLTFYGDESLGSTIYEGKIRFLAMTGGTVAMGIKVRATVTNLVEGETPVLVSPETPVPELAPPEKVPVAIEAPPEETPVPTEQPQAPPEEVLPEGSTSVTEPIPPLLPPAPAPSRASEWPILPIAGIAAGAAIIITLIVVLLRRPRY